jgi:UDP-N-acetylmuramyl pentapeptide phosphotransferase/UDP-N-acetylglucosamine-1-phosphate transferase
MFWSATLSFGISLSCLVILVSRFGSRFALDRPNKRSLHVFPVPRTGGLAIAAGTAGSLALLGTYQHAPLVIALILVTVSFLDDLFGLPTLVRMVVHLIAAGAFLALTVPQASLFTSFLCFFAIAWMTNLFNFMDGSDGLAGGMAVIGFATYGFSAHLAGTSWLALASFAISSASLGFLLFNFAPAKIFLGDSGSIPLGFLAGAIGVGGWSSGTWSMWFPLIVFSPFIFDATLTLLKRLWRGERVWDAHRDHYYQRVLRMGLGHRNTALCEYALMTGCAVLAVVAEKVGFGIQALLFVICACSYVVLAIWIDLRWARSVDKHECKSSQPAN